jgi:quinol monooxygenase YgiN
VINSFGIQVRLTAQPGRGDELTALLIEAADGLYGMAECLLYLITRPADNDDVILITEAWTSREAHEASLQRDQARAVITQAMPLIAGALEATELRTEGGKGLDPR